MGFIVRQGGIEIDQAMVKAIQDMSPPKNVKELRGLQVCLAYIKRFISNLASRCHPFSHLKKKGLPFEWDDSCQKAFDSIKRYLSNPPALGAPILDKPFLLYIAAQEYLLGVLHPQENSKDTKKALYYLSHTLVGAELNYSPIEKMCLVLLFIVQNLRHYMYAHTVYVISKPNLVEYILLRLVLNEQLVKWVVILE